MKSFKFFTILICSACCGLSLEAQKAWTLKECVDHALKNNLQVKQNLVASEVSKDLYTKSIADLFPTLNGSASHNYNFGRSVDPYTYQFTTEEIRSNNFSLNSNVTLFSGLQLQNSLRQSKLDYMASKYDVQKIQEDISMNVVAAFLQVLYNKELLRLAQESAALTQKQFDRTKIMFDAGSVSQGTLLDAEALLATQDLNVVTAQSQLDNSVLSLTQLLDLPSPAGFEVAVPPTEIPDQGTMSMTPEEINSIAMKNMPLIKGSEFKLLSAQKGLTIAKGGILPRLSMYGSLSSGYSSASQRLDTTTFQFNEIPFNDQLDENYSKSVGFSLSIPIFNNWQTQTAVKRARLNVLGAEYSLQNSRNQVYKSVQQAHTDALAASKKYIAYQKTAASLAEAFRYADKRFNLGAISSIEYTTAKNNTDKANSDLLQAKYDLIFRIKILDFYAGKPLTF